MAKKKTVLVCKRVIFYSQTDEDAFFEWIGKTDCIENFYGEGDRLYLELVSDDLYDHNIRDLLALFYRYSVDMKQLKRFLNKENKDWFFDNKKAYWHKQVFGE